MKQRFTWVCLQAVVIAALSGCGASRTEEQAPSDTEQAESAGFQPQPAFILGGNFSIGKNFRLFNIVSRETNGLLEVQGQVENLTNRYQYFEGRLLFYDDAGFQVGEDLNQFRTMIFHPREIKTLHAVAPVEGAVRATMVLVPRTDGNRGTSDRRRR